MKNPSCLNNGLAIGAALLLAGCVPLTPNLDSRFGDSVRLMQAQQTINPDASSDTRTASLDGQTAHAIIGRYNKSYSAPAPQPNVFTIGVGGGGGGSGR